MVTNLPEKTYLSNITKTKIYQRFTYKMAATTAGIEI